MYSFIQQGCIKLIKRISKESHYYKIIIIWKFHGQKVSWFSQK